MGLAYNRIKTKTWAKSQIPILWEKRITIALLILGVFVLFVFRDVVQLLFLMALFIAIGTLSLMYNRWIKVSLGFELIMLGTVLIGMIYGTLPALIVGFVSLFFAEVLTNRFTYSTAISFVGMFAVAMIIPLFKSTSITWAGIWLTLIYDVIILPGYLLLGSSPGRTLLFFVTHLIFNVWLFITIAPAIFSFLT